MNRKIHAHFHWHPLSIVRYCSFSFFREDYAETGIVLFLIFRIGLIISARIVFRFVRRSAVRSPASCEIGNGTYSWKFAPAISPVSLHAPQGRNTPPSVCHISSVSVPAPHGFPSLSREGLCPRNSIFSLKK